MPARCRRRCYQAQAASWVGKAARNFAAHNGNRIQIIEGRELKRLIREHLGIDVLLRLPKLPPGWEQHDIT
ncbi:MAG: hypothetical protein WAL41_11120 [Mycobacterium sp.]